MKNTKRNLNDNCVVKKDEKTCIKKNRRLVKQFPFLLPRNIFTDKTPEDYCYTHTLLDLLPDTWYKAFGEDLCKDLKKILIEDGLLDDFRIEEIKEKYGTLRIYTNFTSDKIDEVLRKYEDLSMMTCICCGKPATHYNTSGWINFVCKNCAEKDSRKLTIEDIPSRTLYSKDGETKIESFYKTQMEKLWK